jgi:protease I
MGQEIQGKRVAVLVEDLYQDLEVWYPFYRLKEAGVSATSLGTGKRSYKSKHGYEIEVQGDVHEAKAQEYRGVIVPGGYAPDILRRYDAVNRFVADIFKQGGVVSSICHGLWVCISAGILKGKKVTCFSAIKDDVINAGATYVDQEVAVDERIVTSRKPDDLPAFMRETLRLLASM